MRRLELARGAAVLATAAAAMLASDACSRRAEPDAYGNVEAVEVVVGAIDATELNLQQQQLAAQRTATASRIDELQQQIEGLEAQRSATTAQRDSAKAQRDALVSQLEIARRNYERTNRLFAQQAATAQQLDQAERDFKVLGDQIKAQDEQIRAADRQITAQAEQVQTARAQQQTVRNQIAAADAQVSQVDERIRKSQVTSPIAGTVLTTYARAGEVVQAGQPLFKMASLDAVDVRAYVAEPQLATIRLGQDARVTVDAGHKQMQTMTGSVDWISSQAEFTPTNIQTREERADLVYAVKVHVANPNGVLKIGMPADVQFAGLAAPGAPK